MRILAITPWDGQGTPSGQACGIANYAQLLQAHLPSAAGVELVPCPEGLDPNTVQALGGFDAIWLNYHRGLHSRWTPEWVVRYQAAGTPVAITFHDTYGESAPDPLTSELHRLADAFVVHEPCVDLPRAVVIRQGVPGWEGAVAYSQSTQSWCGPRPILGTVGFNFPWKGFDQLAEVTAEAGWAYLVVSNNATKKDTARWTAANPYTLVLSGYRDTGQIVSLLGGCDATAFPYQCANSGTSGAIRLGLAARKPVLAFEGCRQFELRQDVAGSLYILWCQTFEGLRQRLAQVPIQRVDPGIVYLAERDSWPTQAARYAALFEGLAR